MFLFMSGAGTVKKKLNCIGDDVGDSISQLNSSFCELTALYWIWKNDTAPIVGLVHYRRYFRPIKKYKIVRFHPIAASADFHEFSTGCDIILPQKKKNERGI
ncbi:hypothetical protein OS42_46090 [Dickeya oryzae]